MGCGFGGLLVKLAPVYADTLMLGMELRDKVCTTFWTMQRTARGSTKLLASLTINNGSTLILSEHSRLVQLKATHCHANQKLNRGFLSRCQSM